MGARELREKWIETIGKVDERFLLMVDDLYDSYLKGNEIDLTDEHKQLLDTRLLKHNKNPDSGKEWSILNKEIYSKYGL